MSKIEKLIKEKCPDGVDFCKIDEICVIQNGYTPSKKVPEYWVDGDIPWFRMEDIRTNGKVLNYALKNVHHLGVKGEVFPANSIIFSTTATIGEHALITVPFLCNQQLTHIHIKENQMHRIDIKYLFYCSDIIDDLCKKNVKGGGTLPAVSLEKFRVFEIPVPPIEVQQEIVRILDKFTELEAELQAELEARKKQYEYYRETMLSFNNDIEIVTLDKCADIGTGSSNTVDGIDDGVYPFFVRSQKPLTMNQFEYDEIATITAGDGVGVGKVFHFIDGKYALHQRAYRIHITDKRINPKFFHYYFVARFPKFIFGNMYEGSVPSIRRPMLNKFEVPIPSMEEQNRIVDILDKFEEYCNNEEKGLPLEIEARHKQYEYYRDKLLTFERKVV